ncbi:ABC-type multidrug transport system permease subunit [Paenibacillus sp. DS2015]
MDSRDILIFIILSFILGVALILAKNSVPPALKRWMALTAVIMILIAFSLIIFSFLSMGS